ncbi:DinB family protein [Aquimarina sp. RZ0]|uniref:DinB family protein n=1 Tax=Aquimarina sp. RZ0 TaxID=2607730 RepID=UPI0011F38B8B|nr:DinB family protein [Aquimarina sp. RZ0]KAA1244825.1 DinB family protein [Aquimarina sp. RZ0]
MDIEDSITQLEEVFEGFPWYGPPILKSLKTIPVLFWDQKMDDDSHSITELVYHMIDWRIFVIEKIKGNELFSIEMNSENDWRKKVFIATEVDKEEILKELTRTQNLLIELLMTKPDSWMNELVDGKDYKNSYMVLGSIQHDIYHTGQINLIYSRLQ